MRLTRHVPEIRGVVTLQHDPDGWRAELSQRGFTELAPLAHQSAGEALRGLGLDGGASWATELAAAAGRRQATMATAPTEPV